MQRYTGLLLVSRLQSDLNRLFESALRMGRSAPEGGDWAPAVDMSESEEEIVVRVDVPGIPESALAVRLQGEVLTIEGNKELAPPGGGRFHCMERSRGRFLRALRLSSAIDPRRGEARLENGLLTIALPKIQDRRAAPIEVPIRTAEEDRDR